MVIIHFRFTSASSKISGSSFPDSGIFKSCSKFILAANPYSVSKIFYYVILDCDSDAAMELDGKKGVVEADTNSNIDAMAALFGFLVRNLIVSENQVKKGIDRLHKILPDLSLDVPAAPSLLAAFEQLAAEQGCISVAKATTAGTPAKEANGVSE